MDASDSKSRDPCLQGPCGHKGSAFAKASADGSNPSSGTNKTGGNGFSEIPPVVMNLRWIPLIIFNTGFGEKITQAGVLGRHLQPSPILPLLSTKSDTGYLNIFTSAPATPCSPQNV